MSQSKRGGRYHDSAGHFTDRKHSVEYQREMAAKRYLAHNAAKRREETRINSLIFRAAKIGGGAGLVVGFILGAIIL